MVVFLHLDEHVLIQMGGGNIENLQSWMPAPHQNLIRAVIGLVFYLTLFRVE
jgi:hypothetical protein